MSMRRTRSLRVCHVVTHLDVGGATEVALNACAHVSKGWSESVLVSGSGGDAEPEAREHAAELGVDVVTVPSLARAINPVLDVRAALDLRRIFRSWRPDVVHTHSSKAGIVGRWGARRERVPVVVHSVHGWSFHDHMPRWNRALYVRLERLTAKGTDRIVTVSTLDRDKGLSARIGSPEQYVTIPPLNDLRRFFDAAGDRVAARARLGLPVDAPVVGTVGRLSEQKDPLTFIRAAARIAEQLPEARFVMVGDGPLRGAAKLLATELQLGHRLVLTGVRRDVPEIVPAFDVFLLASLWEGMPMVIPQAMASGVAVVASTADGNREIVHDGENGLLAPSGSPDALAERALRLLRDASLSGRVAAAGRLTAPLFDLERTVPELERLYLECARHKHLDRPDGEPLHT
jgi:glycosyltransferase involved in cell wall biosynthesis